MRVDGETKRERERPSLFFIEFIDSLSLYYRFAYIENPATGLQEPHIFEFLECNSISPSSHGHCPGWTRARSSTTLDCRVDPSRRKPFIFGRLPGHRSAEECEREVDDRLAELANHGYICHWIWSCKAPEASVYDRLPDHPTIVDTARTEQQMLRAIDRAEVDGWTTERHSPLGSDFMQRQGTASSNVPLPRRASSL